MSSTSSTPEILVFGEVLWDLLPKGEVLGGAAANCAYWLARQGRAAALVSAVGDDLRGTLARDVLASGGVDVSLIKTGRAPTGTVRVDDSDRDNPVYTIVPGVAYDSVTSTPEIESAAAGARVIYFGTLSQRSPVTRDALQSVFAANQNAALFYDVNLRPGCGSEEEVKGIVRASLERAHIVKINEEEARTLGQWFVDGLTEERSVAAALCRDFSLEACIVTLGERGVFAAMNVPERADEVRYVAAPPRRIEHLRCEGATAIGAGDAFSAGFINELLKTNDELTPAALEACCDRGNVLGALAACHPGAMPPLSRDEIEAFNPPVRALRVESGLEAERERVKGLSA